ncbi:MAG: hypothetical protein B6I24_00325 [Bacteroidetes bacterium 4572_128]|nr:MAG: hypothetical protein B6I24_00325 [Bacteroidetes bacterium 4572_128]
MKSIFLVLVVFVFSFTSCEEDIQNIEPNNLEKKEVLEKRITKADLAKFFDVSEKYIIFDDKAEDFDFKFVSHFTEEEEIEICSLCKNLKDGESFYPFYDKNGKFNYFYGELDAVKKKVINHHNLSSSINCNSDVKATSISFILSSINKDKAREGRTISVISYEKYIYVINEFHIK